MCEEAAKEYPGCVTLGPIIHNEFAIDRLREEGVRVVSGISEIPRSGTVIIRSHGISGSEYKELEATGARIIDATCPDVKKIHEIASRESAEGRTVVIIGERSHPEVTAISGWCDKYEVFQSSAELLKWLGNAENSSIPTSVVVQTTNSRAIFDSCCAIIKKVCTNYKIFDTICSATCKRQQEAEELSKIADVMIVVGGKESANSLRLADICRQHCERVIFAESVKDLENVDIRTSDTVGIAAGASTPAWIIKEVTHKMSQDVKLDETQEGAEPEVSDPELVAPRPEEKEAEPENVEGTSEDESTAGDAEPEQEAVSAESPATGEDASAEENGASESGADESLQNETTDDANDSAKSEDLPPEETLAPIIPEDGQEAVEEDSDPDSVTETFEEMLEKSIKTLHTGEKVTGVVTSITATEVSVDLGTKQSGYIPIAEFTDDANPNIDDIVKVGDNIESFVMRVNDVEGMVMLSKKRLDAVKNWDIIEASKESRAIVEGLVTEENKGGIVVNVKGVRVFVPSSQTGLPKSSPMSDLVKKTVKLRITEVNQSRRRVVGSIRAVQADERREKSDKLWSEIETGKRYDGVVKSMTSYGVFVDIGGVDGMIHISELSWTRIKQPSEVMAVGDEVSVYVLSFDKDNRKISLGYKKSEDNPWTLFTKDNSIGDVVNVKIVKMMPFGAFAEIIPGVDGLIHISQITDHRIGLPSEILSNDQTVDVKITEIDNDRKKVSLSIRALIEPSSEPLDDNAAARIIAAAQDKTPVIVYDTDAPLEEAADLEAKGPEDAPADVTDVAETQDDTAVEETITQDEPEGPEETITQEEPEEPEETITQDEAEEAISEGEPEEQA